MHDNRRMTSKVSAFVIWALFAASLMFWALRLLAQSPKAPAHVVPASQSSALRGDLARLLGTTSVAVAAAAPAPAAASRFKLIGVAAPKGSQPQLIGVALIAVDGKPARAYRVGAKVDGELTLRALDWRTASLGPADGAGSLVLEMPPRAAAATGTLPPPSFSSEAPAPPVPSVAPTVPSNARPAPPAPTTDPAQQAR